MRIIELNAENWTTVVDFYGLAALGAPEGHGNSVDALVDSMVWGGINVIEPPYAIRISGTRSLPKDVQDEMELARGAIVKARSELRTLRGPDVDIRLETEC